MDKEGPHGTYFYPDLNLTEFTEFRLCLLQHDFDVTITKKKQISNIAIRHRKYWNNESIPQSKITPVNFNVPKFTGIDLKC